MPLTLRPDLIPPVRDTLETARDILLHVGWTQHTLARDATGFPVSPADPTAQRFCLLGAIYAASDLVAPHYQQELSPTELYFHAKFGLSACCPESIPPARLNDACGTTLDTIVTLLEDALAHLHPHDHPVGRVRR